MGCSDSKTDVISMNAKSDFPVKPILATNGKNPTRVEIHNGNKPPEILRKETEPEMKTPEPDVVEPNSPEMAEPEVKPMEYPPPPPDEVCTPPILAKMVTAYNPDCELVSSSAKFATKPGDNYMSILYAVQIQLKNKVTGDAEEMNVMFKTIPRDPIRQVMLQESASFIKDINFYHKLIPAFKKFQLDAGIEGDEVVEPWPDCYATLLDGKEDYVAMQNLKAAGYRMPDRMKGLNAEEANLVLKNLAQFHAISYGMHGGDRVKIMATYPWLEEKLFCEEKVMPEGIKSWMKTTFEHEAESLLAEGLAKEASLLKQIYGPILFSNFDKFLREPVSNCVVNHADLWTNNILLKYKQEDEGETLERMKFVDFGLARTAPRSVDVSYFLFSSIPMDDLNNLEESFLCHYHTHFTDFLAKLGVKLEPDVEEGLSWEKFQEEWDNCKFFGIIQGLLNIPLFWAESEDVSEMKEGEEVTTEEGNAFLDKLMKGKNPLPAMMVKNLAVNHLPRCPQMEGLE